MKNRIFDDLRKGILLPIRAHFGWRIFGYNKFIGFYEATPGGGHEIRPEQMRRFIREFIRVQDELSIIRRTKENENNNK